MALPEYYLTRVEREILVERGNAIVAYLADGGAALDLIELGSGDGDKTIELCRAAMRTDHRGLLPYRCVRARA